MDLNHIELPAATIVDFYSSSLVDLNDSGKSKPLISEYTPIKENALKQDEWIVLGQNKKKIQIILNNESIHLADKELHFLTGILAACRLTLADVAIFNLNNYPAISYKEFITHFNSKTIFLFGVPPLTFGLPINFPEFQPQTFNKITFLFSPTLNELEADKILKSKLWVCLRRIFGL